MFGRELRVALLAATLFACGGAEGPLDVKIDSASRALFPGLASASVRLYPPEATCAVIQLSGDGPVASFAAAAAIGGELGTAELDSIVAGAYTLVVWGYDAQNGLIAFGCKEGVVIEDGKQTEETIFLGNP